MKKVLVLILAIIILSSFAYEYMIPSLASSSLIISMQDNEPNESLSIEDSSITGNPDTSPIDEENKNEEHIDEQDDSENPTEFENPEVLDPIPENDLERENQTTSPAGDNEPSQEEPVETETEAIPKPVHNIIHTLNKKNAWSHKTVYLTFDDGPSPITDKVLNILKKEEVKATFFVIGTKTDEGKATLKRISEEGHSIGNHTYSHNYNYIYKNADNFFDDLYKNENIIYESTGIRPKIIRFPGGSNNTATKTEKGKKIMNEIMDRLQNQGYIHFDWNASSGDASVHPASVEEIINNTLTWISRNDNAVVLFHDTSAKTNTLKALPTIIEKLKFLGCNFEILTTSSPHVAFVKNNSTIDDITEVSSDHIIEPVDVIINNDRIRKPPHVIRKLLRLEREMEEMYFKK
ncbi:Peptidoglycan/xylan/chitin deacetylase, PgdA/CDA1 family [Proteiniborus ethanoligenes]|uniref:Peptidoglycan/xylan/chitin deacetylase, PgdA/CDA1 family n=1 Tax=Proteiniborus ethanoligenes TaxID=415015 RepID=A0A1H3SKC6_9FIRM|nr:polysaccharide deacetylase family protein [Proteiniborus ethanoligenes]SDZ38394.1 Peptidoglycan/xylan/chitin deacetylase, PgdA/CDA1 family [Proteiniborus ethanoligenes]